MIEREIHEEMVADQVVDTEVFICNKCGKRWDRIHDGEVDHDNEYHEIELYGGWGNWVIGDLRHTTIHLCQACVGEFLDSLTIPPVIENGVRDQTWDEWKACRPEWRT